MEKLLEQYPAVLSVGEAAEILGVTATTVRKLINKKQLIAVRVGRLIRIPKDRLMEFLANTT